MLALVYLVLIFWVGDTICRRFYRFVSVPHRLAASFLVGMLTSFWFVYLGSLVFMRTTRPMLWGDLLFFAVTIGVFVWLRRKESPAWAISIRNRAMEAFATKPAGPAENAASPAEDASSAAANSNDIAPATPQISNGPSPVILENADEPGTLLGYLPRPRGSDRLDWIFIGAYFILAGWLMFATFNSSGGKLQTSNLIWMDFGPNTSVLQSFAVGKNFPTQHPLFAGENMRYHFLFWFQAANLEFLGLDPAWSVNFLSILSMLALLILTMVLGEVLFNSRAVGYVASALFFFFGSLAYIPFLHKQGSLGAALHTFATMDHFLPSIWPEIRGETWGNYSQAIFINQRHLLGGIAILMLVLIFLVLRYRDVPIPKISWQALKSRIYPETAKQATAAEAGESADRKVATTDVTPAGPSHFFSGVSPDFIFSGALLGLLPLWNGAAFLAAFTILLVLFILLPRKKEMAALGVTAGIFALPQLLYLTEGAYRDYSIIHWGYALSPPGCVLDCFNNPSIWFVMKYLGFLAGFKWLLVALAVVFATRLQRRFLVAGLGLLVLTFLFQLSPDILNNNKPLHVWIIVMNLFAAYGLYRLWTIKTVPVAGRVAAFVLAMAIVPGGIIDLFPIHNVAAPEADLKNDALINWVRTNTKGDAVFLSDRYVWHPIPLAGRKIFFGGPFFTWSAGYNLGQRERVYRQMFQSHDPAEVFRLLKENHIDYVAYDDTIRRGDYIYKPNEQVFTRNFERVWFDQANHYGHLAIYKVPEAAPESVVAAGQQAVPGSQATASPTPVAVSMFTGGKGTGPGQFDNPIGMAIDRAGNILISDMNNGRIQKFSPQGDFISSFGATGSADGEFGNPFGIAVDRYGNIYVIEAGNERIQKFKSDGTFIALWKRTVDELDMHGPRKAAIGPDDSLYVVDMGHARVIKFNFEGRQTAHWGENGTGDSQFRDMTSVAVDPKENKVYVTDPGNKRIQIFDSNGKFLGQWPVDEWGTFFGFEDLAIDAQARRLYASSSTRDDILVFDLNNGNRLTPLQPKPPDKLENPTAIALSKGKLYVLNNRTARVSVIDLAEAKK
jgi:DNA-binding beta-propeller fold protein YncE